MEDKAEDIVIAIIKLLHDRGGFDDWWDSLDDDIQAEIIEDLEAEVDSFLELED